MVEWEKLDSIGQHTAFFNTQEAGMLKFFQSNILQLVKSFLSQHIQPYACACAVSLYWGCFRVTKGLYMMIVSET